MRQLINMNGVATYYGDGYKFVLTDEKYHKWSSLVIGPQHIKVLGNATDLDAVDLKTMIIRDWFTVDNEMARKKRRKK